MDEKKRAGIMRSATTFNKTAAKYENHNATYIAEENTETGPRTITTTVVHELKCAGVGHAIQAPGDTYDAEIAMLLSRGRAYLVLGGRMIRRGLEMSKDMDRLSDLTKQAVDELWPKLQQKLHPKMSTDQWRAFHEARLNDALKSGEVIKCRHCGDFFGIKGKLSKRQPVVMPEGLKKRWVRQHQCPHCFQWCDNPGDLATADKLTKEHEETLAVKRELDAKCNACGACDTKGCPGWWKDPCDEAKAVLSARAPQLLVDDGTPPVSDEWHRGKAEDELLDQIPPEQRHGPETKE